MYQRVKFGQYIPGDSILHNLDARTKVIMTGVLLILLVVAAFPYKLAFIFLPILYLIWASNIKLSLYLEALRPFAWLIIITVVLQLFLVRGTPLFTWAGFSISQEGIYMALSLSIRISLILLVIKVLTLTTSPAELMNGIEKLLQPFSRMGLPVEELVMIMTISLRFIPLFLEEAQRLQLAQKGRGIDFSQAGLSYKLPGLVSLLIPLLKISFNRAMEMATAMEVRCYGSGSPRTYLYTSKFGKKDFYFIILLLPITLFTFV